MSIPKSPGSACEEAAKGRDGGLMVHTTGKASLYPVAGERGGPSFQGETWPEDPVRRVGYGMPGETKLSLTHFLESVYTGHCMVRTRSEGTVITSAVGHSHVAQSPQLWY